MVMYVHVCMYVCMHMDLCSIGSLECNNIHLDLMTSDSVYECILVCMYVCMYVCVTNLISFQVLVVSSQLSLLTATCEAILSLMYPLTWSLAYIPVLPYPLLGVLGAPVPFLIGLHTVNTL